MALQLQREKLADCWDEMVPLVRAHYHEVAHFQDIPLEPDKATYLAVEASGQFRFFTARVDGALIGYSAYFVRHNVHYAGSLQASEDVLFLAPEHRKGGLGREMIAYADDALRAEGVQVVMRHVKADPRLNFGRLLERVGYTLVDHIYARRLDQ